MMENTKLNKLKFRRITKKIWKTYFPKNANKKRKQIEFRNFIRSESIHIYLWDEQFEAFLRYSDVMVIFPSIFGFSFICLNYGFDWNEMWEHFAFLSLIRRLWSISTKLQPFTRRSWALHGEFSKMYSFPPSSSNAVSAKITKSSYHFGLKIAFEDGHFLLLATKSKRCGLFSCFEG